MSDLPVAMRPHLAAMWADSDRLVRRVTRAVTGRVPSYAATPSSEVWIGMTRILERVAHGDPFGEPTEEDRAAAYATGVQGARSAIAPEDLVAAILLGAGEVEADVMARAAAAGVSAEVRLEGSVRSRRWAEQVTVWAAQGLRSAARDEVERHVLEDRFVRGMREGMRRERVVEQAESLGVDPHGEWFAVLALRAPGADPAAATALRLAQPGLWSRATEGTAGGPELLGLVPRAPLVRPELVAGIAGPVPLTEATAALIEASRAARAAHRFGRHGLNDLERLGLLVPLYEDPALAGRLVRRWLTPLAEPARHDLVVTLRCWIDHDGRIEPVARELAVHPNTVRNRLGRIGDALGPSWRAPAARAEIWAALQVSAGDHGTSASR